MSEPVSFNAQRLATPGGPDSKTQSPTTTKYQYYRPEKKYPCEWPGCTHAPFTCRHNVKQHTREVHTGERPHACPVCADDGKSNAFSRPASLYRHVRQVHKLQCDGKKRRGSKRGVGPTFTPQIAHRTPESDHAAQPVTSYPSPSTPSPALSNMAAQMFPMGPQTTSSRDDRSLTHTGQAFSPGISLETPSPPIVQPDSFTLLTPPKPLRGRCPICSSRPTVSNLKIHFDLEHRCHDCSVYFVDVEAHIELVHSAPPTTLPDSSQSLDEFMASLEETSRALEFYSPSPVQQPTPQHFPAHFQDVQLPAGATMLDGQDYEEFGISHYDGLDFSLLDGGDLEDSNAIAVGDIDFDWALSGLQQSLELEYLILPRR